MNTEQREKYINLFTDYGFKRIFGSEVNKELLIDFLNELLKEQEGEITNLEYLNSEQINRTETDRKAIYDLYCENEQGEKFIVELQKAEQNHFKDRSIFYSTFPIQNQAKKGKWNYQLKAVYTIGILNFTFTANEKHKNDLTKNDDKAKKQIEENNKIVTTVKLLDIESKEVFYDKLTFVYIEVPKFNLKRTQLTTQFDKWLYAFKYLHKLQERPAELQEQIFNKLFETAEIAKFTQAEYQNYELSLKTHRDYENTIEYAKAEGIEQGIEQEKLANTKKAIKEGLDNKTISNIVDITIEEIECLRKQLEQERLPKGILDSNNE